jgi:hypothetical protein
MGRIKQAPLSEGVSGVPGIGEDWNPYQAAGFVRRLTVLGELLESKPPAWPPGDAEHRKEAAKMFELTDMDVQDAPTQERMRQRTSALNRLYHVSFFVALIIPLLTIAFKLLLARELGLYYSTSAQARAGNPDAVEVAQAEGAP